MTAPFGRAMSRRRARDAAVVDQEPGDGVPLSVRELRKGRRVRYRVTGMFVALLLVVVGALVYYRWQRSEDCRTAYVVREHSEGKDERMFHRIAERFGADEGEMADITAIIREEYDTMPTPAAC